MSIPSPLGPVSLPLDLSFHRSSTHDPPYLLSSTLCLNMVAVLFILPFLAAVFVRLVDAGTPINISANVRGKRYEISASTGTSSSFPPLFTVSIIN